MFLASLPEIIRDAQSFRAVWTNVHNCENLGSVTNKWLLSMLFNIASTVILQSLHIVSIAIPYLNGSFQFNSLWSIAILSLFVRGNISYSACCRIERKRESLRTDHFLCCILISFSVHWIVERLGLINIMKCLGILLFCRLGRFNRLAHHFQRASFHECKSFSYSSFYARLLVLTLMSFSRGDFSWHSPCMSAAESCAA